MQEYKVLRKYSGKIQLSQIFKEENLCEASWVEHSRKKSFASWANLGEGITLWNWYRLLYVYVA